MGDLTLHSNCVSGNCYKVRLTAAFLDIKLQIKEYDTIKGESRTEEFTTKVSPNGKIPVLQIGSDTFLPESNAACYYLATGSILIPTDRLEHADMLRWMFWEQYQHEPAIAVVRFWVHLLGEESLTDLQQAMLPDKRKACEAVLTQMNEHLSTHSYFAAERLTLADIALYGYTHVAGDAGYDLARWPHVASWCERITMEPGYVVM